MAMPEIIEKAIDRTLVAIPRSSLMEIDRHCMNLSGPRLSFAIAESLLKGSSSSDSAKRIMSGGLLSYLKYECLERQRNASLNNTSGDGR